MDITAAAAATTAAATWLAYLELLETTVGDISAKFEANPLSSRAASSGAVEARSFRARGSMDITAAAAATTAAAAATTAAATWLAYLELLETTVGDICAKFEANPLSSRAASSGEVQARRFRALGSVDITAAAAATTAAATWLAYLELLETTVGDICAKFEANPLSSRAASSGAVEARSFRARGSMFTGFNCARRLRGDFAQAFRAKNRRNQFLCAKSEIFRARSARVREIIFCAK